MTHKLTNIADTLQCDWRSDVCWYLATVMDYRDTSLASRHGFSCLGLASVSTLVYSVLALSRVSMSRHVSCLMTVSW